MSTRHSPPLKLLKAHKAAEDRCVVVLGPNCWGKGRDGATAYKLARENRPRWYGSTRQTYVFVDAPREVQISEVDGGLSYPRSAAKAIKLGEHVVRSDR